jgi:hypothetical protein
MGLISGFGFGNPALFDVRLGLVKAVQNSLLFIIRMLSDLHLLGNPDNFFQIMMHFYPFQLKAVSGKCRIVALRKLGIGNLPITLTVNGKDHQRTLLFTVQQMKMRYW